MLITDNREYAELTIKVNGREYRERIPTHLRLLDFLRDTLHLTGTKEVCGEGECGACTVLVDGQSVNSCLVLAMEVDGSDVITIEGLSHDGELTIVQNEFLAEHGIQCGYCTPGFILAAEELLREHSKITSEQLRAGLQGNICRCTGYQKITRAVESAAAKTP